MKNTFGSDLSLTIFGESHGRAIGAVLDGMAAGVPVEEAFLAACMDKRRARGDGLSTPRVEGDAVQFLSGVVNGRTTGTAIALMIENQNTRSGDYARTADLLRPGHADYTAYAKYHGYQDARGGGHFSGRVTAALVAGGALVLGALNRAGIEIVTHIGRCAGIGDIPFALDDPAALAAQAEALLNKSEGFALLDGSVEKPMKAAIRAAGAIFKHGKILFFRHLHRERQHNAPGKLGVPLVLHGFHGVPEDLPVCKSGRRMGRQHDLGMDKFFLLVVEFRFLVVLAEQPFAALISGPGNSGLPLAALDDGDFEMRTRNRHHPR